MRRCNDRGDVNWVGRLVLQKQKKSSFDDIIERSHKYLSVEEVVDNGSRYNRFPVFFQKNISRAVHSEQAVNHISRKVEHFT